MTKHFFITTAIPYVNARPHIGFALEIIQADTIARYHRMLGEDVYFLTGTDENALKNVQAAQKANMSTKAFVDQNAALFAKLKDILNISYDDFIRTTEKRHFDGAQKLWNETKKEDIYRKKYTGLYCVGCEQFYTEGQLVDGKCPEHQIAPQVVEEENYFFKLSSYQDRLEKLIQSDELKIIPQTRKNEVLSLIKSGLEDFSISRSVERAHGWGVPVPGDLNQIMYVWYDALSNYITALGYDSDDHLFKKYWQENPNRVHIIGKGITRFHAVYWPAMLLSVGVALPTIEFAHGYITVEGKKMSKSLGNVVDPFDLVEKYGIDAVRYYLLREIPAYGDGDFSEKRFKEVYNADLANGLGNLVARVAKLCETAKLKSIEKKHEFPVGYAGGLNNFKFDETLSIIFEEVRSLDRFIDKETPWKITDKKQLINILETAIDKIHQIAFELEPFLPDTAKKIKQQFTGEIKTQSPLFPRLK